MLLHPTAVPVQSEACRHWAQKPPAAQKGVPLAKQSALTLHSEQRSPWQCGAVGKPEQELSVLHCTQAS